jgi:hypothetical protein
MPYWLNGLVPLVYMGLDDEEGSSLDGGYNLTAVVLARLQTLVGNQLAPGVTNHSMYRMFNLGTWNVVRSLLMFVNAELHRERMNVSVPPAGLQVKEAIKFVVGYIQAAQTQVLANGWYPSGSNTDTNTLCTQCDSGHPCQDEQVSHVVGGGHCIVRYPDWMWVLQMLLDMDAEAAEDLTNSVTTATTDVSIDGAVDGATGTTGGGFLTQDERELVKVHMSTIGDWGFNFTEYHACGVGNKSHATEDDGGAVCFPVGDCNSIHLSWCKAKSYGIATHGVSGAAMPLKEGAVRWRMDGDKRNLQLSYTKVSQLERFHGQPTGQFSADEHLGGRNPNRGVELCAIVETVYSLNVMLRVQGDVAFADRAERIMYNALPAALTADMWSHNYLSMINQVTAVEDTGSRIYGESTTNGTIYGLGDPKTGVTPCCTANHNQAWPKWVLASVHASGGGSGGNSSSSASAAVVVSLFAPVNASMPARVGGGTAKGSFEGAVTVEVITDYPFADTVQVVVTNRAPLAAPLWIRVPTWATKATLAVAVNHGSDSSADASITAVPVPAGEYYKEVICPGVPSRADGARNVDSDATVTTVVLELNPDIIAEIGWGTNPPNTLDQEDTSYPGVENAVAIMRGPLMFALPLEEHNQTLNEWVCYDTGCSTDMSIVTNSTWNYLLQLPPADALNPTMDAQDSNGITRTIANPSTMRLVRSASGAIPSPHPFAGSMDGVGPEEMPLHIVAKARTLKGWGMDKHFKASPESPPLSPIVCSSSTACGDVTEVKLVPFGTTRLRMGMLPWAEL